MLVNVGPILIILLAGIVLGEGFHAACSPGLRSPSPAWP